MARLREVAHSTVDALTEANMQLQRIPAEATSLAKVLSGLHDPGYFDDRDLAEHVRGHLDHVDLSRWTAASGAARHDVDELVDKLQQAVGSTHGSLGQAGQELLADARALALSQHMLQTAIRNVDAAVTSSAEPGGIERLTTAIQDLRTAELAVRQNSEQIKVDLDAVDVAPEPEQHHTHTAHHQPPTHSSSAAHGTSAATDPGTAAAGPQPSGTADGLSAAIPDKVPGQTSPVERLEGDLGRFGKELRDGAGDVVGTVAGRVVKEVADKVGDVAEVVHKVGQHNESALGVVRDIGQDASAVGRQEIATGEQQVAQGGLLGTVVGYTQIATGTVVEAAGEGVAAVGAAGAALGHQVAEAGAWGEAQGHRLEGAAGDISEGIRHAANNPTGQHEIDLVTGPGKAVIQPPSDPADGADGAAAKSSAGHASTPEHQPKAEAGAEFAAPGAGAEFAAAVPGAEFAGEGAGWTAGAEAGAEFASPDPAPGAATAPEPFDDSYAAGQPT